jgi:hypothetical protein
MFYSRTMNMGGFSLRRLLGISNAKSKLSKALGVPLTKGGRDAKLGRAVRQSGEVGLLAALLAVLLSKED